MSTFDRYLLRRFLVTFVILFVTFFGLYAVIDGFTNIDEFQESKDGTVSTLLVLRRMAIYYAYQSSMLVELAGPTVAVCAVMVVAALLVKNSEFQPILAAGIPLVRICWPVLAGLLIVTAGVLINQELVIPRIAHRLRGPRSELDIATRIMKPQYDSATGISIWGRSLNMQNELILDAEFILPANEIVTVMTTITAESAYYVPETSSNPAGWVLRAPTPADWRALPLTTRGQRFVRPVEGTDELFIASTIGFELIADGSRETTRQSTRDLVRRIQNPAVSDTMARSQLLLLHQRAVQPILNLIAGLICIPLVIRRESRSLITSLAITALIQGAMLGTLFAGGWLGSSGFLPVDIAAWLPLIICGSIATWASGLAQT